jgi:hypothetical protein
MRSENLHRSNQSTSTGYIARTNYFNSAAVALGMRIIASCNPLDVCVLSPGGSFLCASYAINEQHAHTEGARTNRRIMHQQEDHTLTGESRANRRMNHTQRENRALAWESHAH